MNCRKVARWPNAPNYNHNISAAVQHYKQQQHIHMYRLVRTQATDEPESSECSRGNGNGGRGSGSPPNKPPHSSDNASDNNSNKYIQYMGALIVVFTVGVCVFALPAMKKDINELKISQVELKHSIQVCMRNLRNWN